MMLQMTGACQLDEIISSLRSANTTNAYTLDHLRARLGYKPLGRLAKTHARVPATSEKPNTQKQGVRNTSAKTTRNAKPPNPPPLEIYESPNCETEPLTASKRRALATEAFNLTLKSLTSVVKAQQDNKSDPEACQTPAQTRRAKKSPLQPCSPNKQAKPVPNERQHFPMDSDADTVADCAIVALDCLRKLRSEHKKDAESDQKLEKGALILVEKLISLRLSQKALTETSKVYDQYWKRRKDLRAVAANPRSSLPLRMTLDASCCEHDDLDFISSYHNQVLRLAILLGSQAVTTTLLEDAKMTAIGGPANVVLAGLKARLITEEKAGQQLRTVAQALIKFYSVAISDKSLRAENASLNFSLLIEALNIKCESWTLLKHQADLDREYWALFVKGLKRYEADCEGMLGNKADLATRMVQSACSTLNKNGFISNIPAEVFNIVADNAEKTCNYVEAMKVLQDYSNNSSTWRPEEKMLLCWRLVTIYWRHHKVKDQRLLHLLEQALEPSARVICSQIEHLDNVLLHGARLRNTLTAIVRDLDRATAKVLNEAQDIELAKQVVRMQSNLLRLLSGLLLPICKNEGSEKLKLGLTSFAKTFEALLEVSKYCTRSMPSLQEECEAALERSVEASKTFIEAAAPALHDCEIIAYMGNLLVQTSNLYWLRYMEQANQGCRSQDTLKALELSCSVIDNVSAKTQQSAAYGMKLEKLALSQLSTKNVPLACRSFEIAIGHYIAIGALDDAAKVALCGPSTVVWSFQQSNSYSLGKALFSLTKLRLTYEVVAASTNGWIYDRDNLPTLQRALLCEAQMPAAVDHSFSEDQASVFRNHTRVLLDACCGPELQTYRLRFLSGLLKLTCQNASVSNEAFLKSSNLATLLEAPPCSNLDLPLSSYADSMHHLVHLQRLLQTEQVDMKEIEQHVKSLSSIIHQLPDVAALEVSIDDPNFVLSQLQAIADFGRMLDNTDLLLSCLGAMSHIHRLRVPKVTCQNVNILTELATLHHRLGNTLQAEKVFVAAEQLLDEVQQEPHTQIRWILAYVSYLMDVPDMTRANEVYGRITAYIGAGKPFEACSGRERLEREALISRSAQIASTMAFRFGDLVLANQFIRQAVKLSSCIWQTIEKPQSHDDILPAVGNDTSLHNLSDEMSSLTLSFEQVVSKRKPKGSAYWSHVDLHLSTLRQMINISMHSGLYQDTIYYAEQSRKVAEAIISAAHSSRALAILALVHAKAGRQVEALNFLKISEQPLGNTSCIEDRYTALLRAEAFIEMGDAEDGTKILNLLAICIPAAKASVEPKESTRTGLQKAAVRGKAKTTKLIKEPAKRLRQQNEGNPAQARSVRQETPMTWMQQLLKEKMEVLRNRISLLENNSLMSTIQLLPHSIPPRNVTDTSVINAMTMLRQALVELSSDGVKCVLAETAVALPVRYRSSRKSGRVSFIQATDSKTAMKTPKSTRTIGAVQKAGSVKRQLSSGEKLVVDAQKLLHGLQSGQGQSCSSEMLHLAHKVQYKLTLLTSTMDVPFAMSSSELVLQSLVPKDTVQDREQLTISAERATRERVKLLAWPDLTSLQNQNWADRVLDCTMDDISNIPETWSIVTISLADNQQELLMSKIVGGRSPFLLRIPLSRSDLEIDEGSGFSFLDAKAELLDIVMQANNSAHDTRGQGDRETRKNWYAEREDLDRRLEAWLCNIETVWLGGFRGLMVSTIFGDELLAEFGQNLNQILDNHLPSRQKSGVSIKNKVVLHSHVLELFLGLGHPDEHELDDATTDLLYFVVDILQFSGECNAYDEIDFDAMLVDVYDALRTCYDLTSREQSAACQHTILIVDKEMASFPWESLPCLKNQSVSRMPSLSSVLQRLKKIRDRAPSSQGYSIPADEGAYILNPSSDLIATQSTFQPILQSQLPKFSSIINQAPSESEFLSSLTTNQLLLYFGHGSGAQYIRGRSIRNLDTCAVTLLMGCSSAKMTECGKFESYGMPGYYIGGMSGCMAVVGTLWDVTDRDIDRFALKTMLEWGLIQEDERVTKALEKTSKRNAKSRRSEKTKTCDARDWKGAVPLAEAVCKGRDACLLRYLNGAAPVVYGVPVFLE